MEFPAEPQLYDIDDEFMLGDVLLVKPVSRPGQTQMEVILPRGAMWYDYYTLAVQNPDKRGKLTVPIVMESIPIFVRGGSIIAKKERLRRSSAMMREDPHTIYVFPDGDDGTAEGRVYVDDGTSYEHLGGKFLDVQFTLREGVVAWDHLQAKPTDILFRVDRLVLLTQEMPSTVLFRSSATNAEEEPLEFEHEGATLVIRTMAVNFATAGSIVLQGPMERDDL